MKTDCIVIGAGPNGLAAATYLASKGRQVQIFEARDTVGGIATGDEFHPGYHTTGIVHDSAWIRPWVVDALGLGKHGLTRRPAPDIFGPAPDGTAVVYKSPSSSDTRGDAADSWTVWTQRIRAVAAMLMDTPALDIRADASLWPLIKPAMAVRRLGTDDMMTLLRIGPLCAEDWLAEHIDDRHRRAVLALGGLLGTWMGTRSPTGATPLLLSATLAGDEVVGGPAGFVAALRAACQAAEITIHCNAPVSQIRTVDGRVEGVTLNDGTTADAPFVLSAVGPRRTLLDLVDPRVLPPRLYQTATDIRTRGIVAKMDLALSAPPAWVGCETDTPERVRIAIDPLDIERSFDAAKHRRVPNAPVLDIRISSEADRAPPGHHVASVLVHGAPYDVTGGWNDDNTQKLRDAVLDQLDRCAPGFRNTIVAHRLRTPADLEAEFGLEGGHLFHGEIALDQLASMRPSPSLSRHSTPIDGLYLGSAGTHPGGLMLGASGVLAARAIID